VKIDQFGNGGGARGASAAMATVGAGRAAGQTAAARKGRDGGMSEDQEALDLAADWADISQGLKKDLGPQLHTQWIKPIQLGSFCKETGTLDLFLPTEFSANWVRDRFLDRLQLAWKIARSEVRMVNIAVHPGRRQLPDLRLDDGHQVVVTSVRKRCQPGRGNVCGEGGAVVSTCMHLLG
jgi:chromosomal replication initiator protein